jgi:hypothetical protein
MRHAKRHYIPEDQSERQLASGGYSSAGSLLQTPAFSVVPRSNEYFSYYTTVLRPYFVAYHRSKMFCKIPP